MNRTFAISPGPLSTEANINGPSHFSPYRFRSTAGVRTVELSEKVEVEDGAVAISTMHFAKGLEFRSVVVMACDDEVIPQSNRIESVADDADLEEVYNTERHLLYVACTRARDHLLVTGITPISEFIDDFLRGN